MYRRYKKLKKHLSIHLKKKPVKKHSNIMPNIMQIKGQKKQTDHHGF
jgi:hypothetical protein